MNPYNPYQAPSTVPVAYRATGTKKLRIVWSWLCLLGATVAIAIPIFAISLRLVDLYLVDYISNPTMILMIGVMIPFAITTLVCMCIELIKTAYLRLTEKYANK
jgi:hypothetical protein